LGWVRGSDVTTVASNGVAGFVSATVSGGSRPRTVVAHADYEQLISRLARAAGSDLMIGGNTRGRHNITSTALSRMVADSSLPPLVPGRLRSTWLLTHLEQRTPLTVLMPAAGLKTVRPLEDLLSYAAPLSPAQARAALRGGAG
jgi:hypothetical protein